MAVITGNDTSETLIGTNQDDTIKGNGGDDLIIGGGGFWDLDIASYEDATGSVFVDLAAGTASGADGNDTLVSIRGVEGSDYDDTIIGDNKMNDLFWQRRR